MNHAYIGGERYSLVFKRDYSVPLGYYFRRDASKEIVFYNLSPAKRLERPLVQTILEVEGATDIGELERKVRNVERRSFVGEVYAVTTDPESYEVKELTRLEGVPRINGHVPRAVLERVLRNGMHIVCIRGKNIIQAKLVVPVNQGRIMPQNSGIPQGTRVVRGVGKGQNPNHAIQAAYLDADDNALYL